ncbi:MAG: TIGR04282 family arsenosugar biosynthesis glycosyltransferase [Alphaproteobacteria bacterium]
MMDYCISSPPSRLAAIAVMAKAPQAGKVKTRLVPPLAPDEAMALSACFLRDVTENIALASRDAPIQGYVAYAPAGGERLFDGMLARNTQLVLADGAIATPPRVSGFGCSLLHAARGLFARGHDSVCLLNSDSPTLPTALLRQAAYALAGPRDRIVLGPAEDGGYYLLGLKAPHAHLFEDIRWSSEHVAAETCERARALQLEIVRLAPWYDVDDRTALRRLVGEVCGAQHRERRAAPPYAAPATAACVFRLRLAERLDPSHSASATHVPADRVAS